MHLSGVVTRISDAGIGVTFDDGDHSRYSQDWNGKIVVDRQPHTNELYKGAIVIVKMPGRKAMYRGKTLPFLRTWGTQEDI